MSKGAKSSTKKIRRREHCRDCGLSEAEAGGSISAQGYCQACGVARMRAAITAMKTKSGAQWVKWLARQQAHVEQEIRKLKGLA